MLERLGDEAESPAHDLPPRLFPLNSAYKL